MMPAPPASAAPEPEPEPDPLPEPPPVPESAPVPPEESPLGAAPPEESPDAALVEAEVVVLVLAGAESAPPVAPPGTVSLATELEFAELPPPHDASPIARATPARPVAATAVIRPRSERDSCIMNPCHPCDGRTSDRY